MRRFELYYKTMEKTTSHVVAIIDYSMAGDKRGDNTLCADSLSPCICRRYCIHRREEYFIHGITP